MDYFEESLRLHYEWGGKLDYRPKMALDSREALSLAYTPGVAQPCL
jgi:malate dehydrogenase (oxaloacetate-decarboxylating)